MTSGAKQVRVHVRYQGHVQGVGFRATARWIAERHPVTGWVRNEPDGSVVLEVQGTGPAVEAFLTDVLDRLNSHILSKSQIPAPPVADERHFTIAR